MEESKHLRAIPSVDTILREIGNIGLPRPIVVKVIREHLEKVRSAGERSFDSALIVSEIRRALNRCRMQKMRRVINATGVVIHTNLGRSPLAPAAVDAVTRAASGYSNLELDLDTGTRSSRAAYLEQSLAVICGAEAAIVVNNCAAALVLILNHFASRKPRDRVIISRGELVQIGGGFRVPEILAASGATLHEIGTTNRTTADDYRQAISDETAMLLRVHRSNFYQLGFVQDALASTIAAIARESDIPFVEDLGSGATFDTQSLGEDAGREPTPAAAILDGANLVCFSGDKLLGGPQAGIIAGDAAHVAALKKNPLFRALRCDKLTLAALEATVDLLLNGQSDELPIRRMMAMPVEQLRARGANILSALDNNGVEARLVDTHSTPGGGTLPALSIDSIAITVRRGGFSAPQLADALRRSSPPIVARIADDRVLLDLRTVLPDEDEAIVQALLALGADRGPLNSDD